MISMIVPISYVSCLICLPRNSSMDPNLSCLNALWCSSDRFILHAVCMLSISLLENLVEKHFFYIFFVFLFINMWGGACLSTMWVQHPKKPERGFRFPSASIENWELTYKPQQPMLNTHQEKKLSWWCNAIWGLCLLAIPLRTIKHCIYV